MLEKSSIFDRENGVDYHVSISIELNISRLRLFGRHIVGEYLRLERE